MKELEKGNSKGRGKPSNMNLVNVDRKRSDTEASAVATSATVAKRTSPKVAMGRSPGSKSRPASRSRSSAPGESSKQTAQSLPQQKARAAAEARLAASMAHQPQAPPHSGIMYASTPKRSEGSPEPATSPIDVSKILKDGESPLRGHRYSGLGFYWSQ